MNLNQIFHKKNNTKYFWGPFPPGHFYSPIPDLDEIKKNSKQIFSIKPNLNPSIKINPQKQLALLKKISKICQNQPFTDKYNGINRYFFENPAFGYADSLILYSMIRLFKPKKIIEIGSGYSSCVTIDTNNLFFQDKINLTFIEPYPQLLKTLLKKGDFQKITLFSKKVQDVDPKIFRKLEPNDILFIDSTHVSKIGSDVNHIFFQIIPQLKPGVIIHFHDIFYPFEYPREWISQGLFWNETYLLKAFLQFNNCFKIIFFNDYLAKFHRQQIHRYLPLFLQNTGASFWLQKVK